MKSIDKFLSTEASTLFELVLEVHRTQAEMMRMTETVARSLGTTASRSLTVSMIFGRGEPITVSEIARVMGVSRQNTQRTTDALAENGLVEYLPNPHHRRAKLVSVTDQGRALVEQLTRTGATWFNETAVKLDQSENVAALETLQHLRAQISE
ncbi:MAG: MarR family transcriptional regulator [Gammaproteobacteria bacterium]|jgi:DNA-binding MarR family transcriptional regulator|nr:MarR family transcriptional regulator [Chromatiales bacterium]MDP7153395.1 MarR family transcriptional regulator [Gammaproteobacteria bacterium]MDP7270382.1 MarR family transcriptional regulator [Gammaproteobacteria bacterium]HJP04759.1 MarR family transcriptional regulator [Gammaproteobacteria bacterium]